MGSPPPTNNPSPGLSGGASVDGGFSASATSKTFALPCGLSITLPIPSIGIPSISLIISLLLPPLPSFGFSFKLSCSLSDPIDITGGVAWGGGRTPNAPPDPDLNDEN